MKTSTDTRKFSKVQRRVINEAVDGDGVVFCAPGTFEVLRSMGRVGPALDRFRIPTQAPHGTWFNRQIVKSRLTFGPWR